MSKSAEVMERMAETIIRSIEEGIPSGKWQKPWVTRNQPLGGMPINATTRKPYTGGNVFYLWMVGWSLGYKSGEWATYKQWEAIGAQVRKGETGTQTIRWNTIVCKDHRKDESCDKCGRLVPNVFTLFNADQVDGYTPQDVVVVDTDHVNPADRIPTADVFFEGIGAEVRYGQSYAAYSPATDQISMPSFEDFLCAESFYGTLAHEHIHWSGAKSRLDRDLSGRFGDQSYAIEELVAELGAAMVCAVLGIEDTPRPDHAQYLAHWVKLAREDAKVLWTAASKASTAVNFLVGIGKEVAEPELVSA